MVEEGWMTGLGHVGNRIPFGFGSPLKKVKGVSVTADSFIGRRPILTVFCGKILPETLKFH